MEIKRFALGARFDTYNDTVSEADVENILAELTNAVPASDVRGINVSGGVCPLGIERGVYTVVFTHGGLGKMRRLYRRINSDAKLHAMLEANEPFVQNNVIRNFDGLEFFGVVNKNGVCEGGSGRKLAFCKKAEGRIIFDGRNTILIAPNGFKGTIPASVAVRHISRALRRELPGVTLIPVPVADGGDGTLEAVKSAMRCSVRSAKVTGPYGAATSAEYLVIGGSEAVIESALASGLTLCDGLTLDPLNATSFGTGELICRALHEGVREVKVCLGGSATNDCGLGLARALGFRFVKSDGSEAEHASELADITDIDASQADPLALKAKFTVVCDVRNLLTGSDGATYTFGPQKGAEGEALERLENGLINMGRLLDSYAGKPVSQMEGAGAAGGMGAMLIALFGAEVRSGAEELLELADFDALLKNASFVITGEGRIDRTSLEGKAVGEIIEHVRRAPDGGNKPALALIAGSRGDGAELVESASRFAVCCDPRLPVLEGFDAAAAELARSIASVIR